MYKEYLRQTKSPAPQVEKLEIFEKLKWPNDRSKIPPEKPPKEKERQKELVAQRGLDISL